MWKMLLDDKASLLNFDRQIEQQKDMFLMLLKRFRKSSCKPN